MLSYIFLQDIDIRLNRYKSMQKKQYIPIYLDSLSMRINTSRSKKDKKIFINFAV